LILRPACECCAEAPATVFSALHTGRVDNMRLTLRDFLDVLESIAPDRWAESWDNPGLQIGSPSCEIKKIFSALDPTLRALRAAAKTGAQLLFTHHPLIFKPLSHIDTRVYPGNVIAEAAAREVAVVAAHTNLDAAPGGINPILADLLELMDIKALKPIEAGDEPGLGRIGNLAEPTALRAVAETVRELLGAAAIQGVGKPDAVIQRIAIVGGSGSSLISAAAEKGADLLITGDIGHHAAMEAAALGIALLDGGHFRSEQTAFKVFADTLQTILRGRGWDVTVEPDNEEADPLTTFSD